MEEYYNSSNMKGSRVQIPAFGNWDYCDEMPITQYFESAMQAGLIRGHFFAEDADDLFKIPPAPIKPSYHYHHHYNRKKAKRGGEKQQQQQQPGKDQMRKQGRVYDLNNTKQRSPTRITNNSNNNCNNKLAKAPKAVDEDLYKIPPELLYKKPKRKRSLRSLWSGCLGLSCVA